MDNKKVRRGYTRLKFIFHVRRAVVATGTYIVEEVVCSQQVVRLLVMSPFETAKSVMFATREGSGVYSLIWAI